VGVIRVLIEKDCPNQSNQLVVGELISMCSSRRLVSAGASNKDRKYGYVLFKGIREIAEGDGGIGHSGSFSVAICVEFVSA